MEKTAGFLFWIFFFPQLEHQMNSVNGFKLWERSLDAKYVSLNNRLPQEDEIHTWGRYIQTEASWREQEIYDPC